MDPDEKEFEDVEITDEGEDDEIEGNTDEDGDETEDAAEQSEHESDDPESEDEVDAPPAKRGETRFQKLRNETKQSRAEAEEARREARELKARLDRIESAQRQVTPEQEAERLALMSPEERLEYKLDQTTKQYEARAARLEFQTYDTGDKAAFQALCARDPRAAKYSAEVEKRLTEMRQAGQNVPREALLRYVVGEKVLQNGVAAKRKQQAEGNKNIQRERVRPPNSKGDTQSQRGKTGKTAAARLEGVSI